MGLACLAQYIHTLQIGTAKSHRGNPAANIIAHNSYCLPVFFSGLASLVLSSSEVTLIDQHIKVTVQRLQKLCDKTPHCAKMFLGGQLPGKAMYHLRLLSVFGMISRLQGSIVHNIATYQLSSAKPSSGSWFLQVRDLFVKYTLPSPLTLLDCPMTKLSYKKLVKSKVIDFWETHLREEAANLRENPLRYFKAEYMSLTKPHPIWLTCGSNPFEVHKAVTQARMLSGRYVTDQLSRHWTKNSSGLCSLTGCTGQDLGSLEHILLFCPALSDARLRVIELCRKVASESEELEAILNHFLENQTTDVIMQFLLDCSTLPAVVLSNQSRRNTIIPRLF